ncbi:serine esterase, DUF676 protein [Pelomyxa schiedti]|nr:serine esterase, DUF676 protein [Pelomyxa schiedti]
MSTGTGVVNNTGACHVVVLCHGLQATYVDPKEEFRALLSALKDNCPVDTDFRILTCEANSGLWKTLDGVDVGGQRIANEIEQFVLKLRNSPDSASSVSVTTTTSSSSSASNSDSAAAVVTAAAPIKFTVIGHSLGGLFARVAIGLLFQKGYFGTLLEPIAYIAIETPHLGIRRPPTAPWNVKCVDWYVQTMRWTRTVSQLSIQDNIDQVPFLAQLTTPGSMWMNGLSLFKSRLVISNIGWSPQVPHTSSSLRSAFPYDRKCFDSQASGVFYSHCGFPPALASSLFSCPESSHSLAPPTTATTNGEFISDSLSELLFLPSMLHNLQTLHWRRLDISINSVLAHVLMIAKPPPIIGHTALHDAGMKQGRWLVDVISKSVYFDHASTE